jgi:uncharacterized protein (TIGR01440 family)
VLTEEVRARLREIKDQASAAVLELIETAALREGEILVVGCSTSEVTGETIGKASVPEVAAALVEGILPLLHERGIYLAAQCCEHLNRALIVERVCAEKYGLCEVCVKPVPKAGGSFATTCYKSFERPVAAEYVKADAGMDIGLTLIGMHLKHVAVPVRLSINKIGCANVVFARTRPKCIGGIRAVYDDNLM